MDIDTQALTAAAARVRVTLCAMMFTPAFGTLHGTREHKALRDAVRDIGASETAFLDVIYAAEAAIDALRGVGLDLDPQVVDAELALIDLRVEIDRALRADRA